jgi:hypothetical protein
MNKGKREELQCLLDEKEISIAGITESWAHDEIDDGELKMKGYNVFRRDRKFDKGKTRGGGVLLYVRDDLKAHEIENEESKCEALMVSIKILGVGNLIVGVCYRSPTAGREEFENLSRIIRKHTDEVAVIMGDFNSGGIN